MTRDTWEMLRASMWTGLVSTQCGFAFHPGTTRDAAKPRSVEEICAEADRYLAEFDRRFKAEDADYRLHLLSERTWLQRRLAQSPAAEVIDNASLKSRLRHVEEELAKIGST